MWQRSAGVVGDFVKWHRSPTWHHNPGGANGWSKWPRTAGQWATALALGLSATMAQADGNQASKFCFSDEILPLQPPEGRLLGAISTVAVDRAGNTWVLHRPGDLAANQRAMALPPVAIFRRDGTYLRGFGGPSPAFEWPTVEHSIVIDPRGHAWITGNFRSDPTSGDDMILEFAPDGTFVRQIGRRGASRGNADTENVHAPGDLAVDWQNRELYVADGYGNQRVAVFDMRTGAFRRSWGAFGSRPPQVPAASASAPGTAVIPGTGDGPPDFNGVHGVILARDGKVYVSDRANQRIQAFTRAGRYLGQVFVNRNTASLRTVSGISFSRDHAQRYIFAADISNGSLVVIDRRKLAIVARAATSAGRPLELTTPHLIATDEQDRYLVSEVTARRVRRLAWLPDCPTG